MEDRVGSCRTGKGRDGDTAAALTHTQGGGDVSGVSRLAQAVVGAQRVDALTVLTEVSHHPALIDVCVDTSCLTLTGVTGPVFVARGQEFYIN